MFVSKKLPQRSYDEVVRTFIPYIGLYREICKIGRIGSPKIPYVRTQQKMFRKYSSVFGARMGRTDREVCSFHLKFNSPILKYLKNPYVMMH